MRRLMPVAVVLAFVLAACGEDAEESKPGAVGTILYSITPGVLANAGLNLPYTQQLGYVGPNSSEPTLLWNVSSGALPNGLSLTGAAGTGQISGTPTVVGNFPFEISLTFGTCVHTQAFALDVLNNAPLVITTFSLPGGSTVSPYAQDLYATGGSGVGYTWSVSAGTLPPGLTLDGKNNPLTWGAFGFSGNLDQSLGGGRLSEVSGIVASRSQPGVFWVHDDSGAAPEFYAIDAQGNVLQSYQLSTTAQDWEDIAMGPGPGGVDYIYIGDVGDNSLNRTNCRIHRVAEPTVPATPGSIVTAAHDTYFFVYPGGSQNCETMLVDWESGTPYLVEKVGGAPRVHKFPMPLSATWTSGSPVTLTQVTASGTFDGTLTAGDASLDARRVVLRGYGSAREYARPAGGTFDDIFAQGGTAFAISGGQQYEAICYSADGGELFTCTEIAGQASAPIYVASAGVDSATTTISGTPLSTGTFNFTVQVTDSAGNTATRAFTIIVQ
ncbi:MAG: putative Ig domain-containing protein [Planctomycetes bacterium]|nr:putative Ig domain-containing protein [Planctomycetota bacterium]